MKNIIKPETKALLDEKLQDAQEIAVAIGQAREAGMPVDKAEDDLKVAVSRLLRMRTAFFGAA